MHAPRIVDGHFHLWNLRRLPYPWLAPDAPPRPFGDHSSLKRNYGPTDYQADHAGVFVEACVHVQANCADPDGENDWIAEIASETGIPNAHVAYVDLTRPDASEVIARLAANSLVRGIRMMLNWHPDPIRQAAPRSDLMDDPAFRRGFAQLGQNSLTFELSCLPSQLPMAARLASDHPDTTLILNHLGWPLLNESDGVEVWRRGITEIARCPNVVLKVSGLWPIDRDWRADRLGPLVRFAIGRFGFERCLYGSNFPIETVMTTMPHQIAALRMIVADATDQDRDALFRTNARRIYRLTDPS